MKKKKKFVFILISSFAVLFPVGFLLGVISSKIAFPMMFTLLGCQQFYNGVFVSSKDNKKLKVFSIIFGILFMIFGIFIVFPSYY